MRLMASMCVTPGPHVTTARGSFGGAGGDIWWELISILLKYAPENTLTQHRPPPCALTSRGPRGLLTLQFISPYTP
jgi:hypothetical protein